MFLYRDINNEILLGEGEVRRGREREGGGGGGEKTEIIKSLSNIYVESCIK